MVFLWFSQTDPFFLPRLIFLRRQEVEKVPELQQGVGGTSHQNPPIPPGWIIGSLDSAESLDGFSMSQSVVKLRFQQLKRLRPDLG